MPIKGVLEKDIMPKNKFQLSLVGMIPITITALSGIEEETDSTELPDRTSVSGGRSGPVEFEIKTPAHHTTERQALEEFYQKGKDPVAPDYQLPGTVSFPSLSGQKTLSYALDNAWCCGRTLPEGEMGDDGEMNVITWKFKADSADPI